MRSGWTLNPNARRGGGERRYSDGDVERAYRHIQRLVGGRVTIQGLDDTHRPGEPTSYAVRKRYGSWTEFLGTMENKRGSGGRVLHARHSRLSDWAAHDANRCAHREADPQLRVGLTARDERADIR